MSDERRERWEEAVKPVEHFTADDGHPAMRVRGHSEIRDAAMAVADEEIIRQVTGVQNSAHSILQENNKLISENDLLRAELESEKCKAARNGYMTLGLERQRNTLRAELEENEGVMRALRRQRDEAEDTIFRVHAVLDEWYGTSDASALSAEIRTALDSHQ